MKLFKVKIDNNPGEWRSPGMDNEIIVLAENAKDAINKVKNGWSEGIECDNEFRYVYGYNCGNNYTNSRTEYRAIEVSFKDIDVVITTKREEKLKRLLKNDEETL